MEKDGARLTTSSDPIGCSINGFLTSTDWMSPTSVAKEIMLESEMDSDRFYFYFQQI